MARGPKGEKRPGDVVGAAVEVAKIATGEVEEELPDQGKRANGQSGGAQRAKALRPERRSEIAQQGASARWG
jgi:hypothetical protein